MQSQMPPRNRRASRRYRSQSSNVICRAVSPGQSHDFWSGDMLDVSREGVSLSIYRRFEPGTPLMVEMFGKGKLVRTIFGKVVRVASICDRWILGCKLAVKLADEEMKALVGAGGAPSHRS